MFAFFLLFKHPVSFKDMTFFKLTELIYVLALQLTFPNTTFRCSSKCKSLLSKMHPLHSPGQAPAKKLSISEQLVKTT